MRTADGMLSRYCSAQFYCYAIKQQKVTLLQTYLTTYIQANEIRYSFDEICLFVVTEHRNLNWGVGGSRKTKNTLQ